MQKAREIIEELSSLIEHDFNDAQTFADMRRDWAVGETIVINGTKNTMAHHGLFDMKLITEIPPGCYFPLHWHDCAELCEVISGELHDKYNGRSWKEGEKALYSAGQKHQPGNRGKTPCFLIAKFQK